MLNDIKLKIYIIKYNMKNIILFDVDGTLTLSRQKINYKMKNFINKISLNSKIDIGIVGGSDYDKQIEQLELDTLKHFKYIFSENGLNSFEDGIEFHKQSLTTHLGEYSYCKLINIILAELSKIDNPIKRGTFIEYRNGMLNVSPIGRNCNDEERKLFFEQDDKYKWREILISNIKKKISINQWYEQISVTNLKFSIGGQISFDIFPEGWDKTYCLQFLQNKYDKIFFIGDKTDLGGNDYEIFNHPDVIGYKTKNPDNTIEIVNNILKSN